MNLTPTHHQIPFKARAQVDAVPFRRLGVNFGLTILDGCLQNTWLQMVRIPHLDLTLR